MPLQTITGTASHVQTGTEIGYAATTKGPQALTRHLITFRVGNKPVRFKLGDVASISDGDEVVVAGNDSQGTIEALAVKNKTTNATIYNPYKMAIVLSIALILISLPMIPYLVGLPLAGLGGYFIWRANSVRMAVEAIAGL